ncbi:hypothetical protein IDH01_04055 [Pelagibacterales bacterium SAG-MED08]|nr:hypothetical protein [Pelagibacterales bacterium SAG-MED08]|tara:strand:+ start:91 stop:411 length:321 start_codon:yes stop_codon:yes gene_type:complete
MRLLILTLLFISVSISNSLSEIKDKRVFNNFYNSCMLEKDPNFTTKELSIYCNCAGKGVVKKFTVKELMILEGKIIAAGKDDEMRVAAANKKFMSIIADCVSKIIK